VGDRWESWKDSLHYIDYAVLALIVLGAAYLFIRWRRGSARRSASAEPAADAPTR
jgi:hypothetical protein